MDRILILQNPHWSGQKHPHLFYREALAGLIKKLSLKEIQVLLGIRRSGKSTLFKLLIDHLSKSVDPKSILYLNLDDPFFSETWPNSKELYRIIETAEKLTGEKIKYLFLDEVQNVKDWQKFVKSAYDSELFKMFVTGSNSTLLKGNYAKLLSGRYVTTFVYPLSLYEIFLNNGITTLFELTKEKSTALKLTEELLFYGGFPEILKINDLELKREVLINYYETIVLKDCIANYNIRDIKTLQELTLYMLTNISSLYSYNSLSKFLGSNENTIKDYIHIFEDNFLLQELKNFSFSLKKHYKSKKKAYCIDNGLIYATSIRFSENKGKLLENLVYTELKKWGINQIFFYNDSKECNYIIKVGNKLIALQVAYEINTANREREISGINLAMEKFKIHRGYIITFNQEETISSNLKIIPFWKIFFQEELFEYAKIQ